MTNDSAKACHALLQILALKFRRYNCYHQAVPRPQSTKNGEHAFARTQQTPQHLYQIAAKTIHFLSANWERLAGKHLKQQHVVLEKVLGSLGPADDITAGTFAAAWV